uniref:Ig-like domain-containing protein n=1 Tax=Seriola lalandi dorsalis TaxID=1841481 RepID=A0A3B4WZT3_SERLL
MFSVALLLLLAPASVTVQPGQRLSITCQVSYSVSTYYTHWIRQAAGKALEWISRDTSIKDSLKNKFSVNLDSSSNTVTLNGQNVQPEDTAVYYCKLFLHLSIFKSSQSIFICIAPALVAHSYFRSFMLSYCLSKNYFHHILVVSRNSYHFLSSFKLQHP